MLLVAAAFGADSWDVRGELGGEFDISGHGIATVAARRGDLTLGLYTDTLEARYSPSSSGGRAWVAARAQLFAGGLLITRWDPVTGARTPGQDMRALNEGVEGGGVAYLPKGGYFGGYGVARWWHFAAMPTTTRDLPKGRIVSTADAVAGVYGKVLHAWVRAGLDYNEGVQPHLHLTVSSNADVLVLEGRLGTAEGADEITATRVGGMNPYVVPLAGAGWAQFYVEDYAGLRVGPRIGFGERIWTVAPVADAVFFDGRGHAAASLWGRWKDRGRQVDLAVGYAPTVPRPEEDGPAIAAFLLFSLDWGEPGLGPREAR